MRRLLLLLLSIAPAAAAGQSASGARSAATDSVFARAQRLVAEGQGESGRALVQAQLEAAPTGSPRYVEALYWRAVLASTTADADRDLKRLVIDYPLSARSADALMRLGQLEIARGERQQAITHLDRLVKEHGESPMRARANYWIARAWFDEGSIPTACARLGDAWRSTPPDSAELRNQVEYYNQRCAGVDTTVTATASPRGRQGGVVIAGSPPAHTGAPAPHPSVPVQMPVPPASQSSQTQRRDSTTARATGETVLLPPPARDTALPAPPPIRDTVRMPLPVVRDTFRPAPAVVRDSARTTTPVPLSTSPSTSPTIPPKSAPQPAPTPTIPALRAPVPSASSVPAWTVQVGAYKTRAEADQMRKSIGSQGYDARVWESAGYFKVRVGRYASRTAATSASDAMRNKRIAVYVTEAEPR